MDAHQRDAKRLIHNLLFKIRSPWVTELGRLSRHGQKVNELPSLNRFRAFNPQNVAPSSP